MGRGPGLRSRRALEGQRGSGRRFLHIRRAYRAVAGARIPSTYGPWRSGAVHDCAAVALEQKRRVAESKGRPTDKIKLSKRDTAKVEQTVPATLLDALETNTGDLLVAGWSRPPGSRWIDYTRPEEALNPKPGLAPLLASEQPATVARYALASPVLPRLTDAVPVAERIRRSLIKHTDGAQVFVGKHDDGRPLRGHQHAFIIPEANGSDGRLSHVTLIASMGFDARACRALEQLHKVWGHGGHDIQLVLLGIGQPPDFRGLDLRAGQCPLLDCAQTWVSRTPFVPTRHPKRTRNGKAKIDPELGEQIGSPTHDLWRLIQEAGFPAPVAVERIEETSLGGRPTRWLAFRTDRYEGGAGDRSSAVGHGFRIRFPMPVMGPLAFGYGAHFGLGVFAPEGVY